MKAAIFHKPKDIRVETVDDPRIEDPRDIILRVTKTAICGSDLHIYNGAFPQLRPMALGHEFMGVVEEVGSNVRTLQKDDRVVVPFPIACGGCWFCTHAFPTQCEFSNPNYGADGGLLRDKGAALFGYTDLYGGYNGGQAEYVRVPYADYGPRKVPADLADEQVLFLTYILPTGYAGIDWASVQPGETVAVFGCGPVGLMALKAARLRGASRVIGIDIQNYRLAKAREVASADTFNIADEDAIERIRELTEGRGADVCIDAVGLEVDRSIGEKILNVLRMQRGSITAVELCFRAVRRGGRVSILGVYGTDYDNFPLGQMLDKGLSVFTGQAPVHNYIDQLLAHIQNGRLRADDIITHRLPLSEIAHGYEIFNKKQDDCVKVVLEP
jgi:S-(hydroxymethyl)glutathione dehydrogenase/alcohol dehydrogenase